MNNIELVDRLMKIYNELPTVYAKGGIGWKLTDYRYNYLRNQYADNKKYLTPDTKGKYACDCSGMIVGAAYDGWRVDHEPTWSKAHDWNDKMLHDRLTDKCKPQNAILGMCLWKKGHVGLYVGNGMSLDCNYDSATSNGIHLRKIEEVGWTEAGKLPEIQYVTPKVGDVVPMVITKIDGNKAYGETEIVNPAPTPTPTPTPVPEIKVGSRVVILPGAVSGGGNPAYANKPIDPRYANGQWVDKVKDIATFNGEKQALLETLWTWVAFKYLKVVE